MNAARDDYIPPHTLRLLRDFLYRSRSTWSPQEAMASAVTEWIARQRTPEPSMRGYQWKQLFLRDGTDVRMICDGKTPRVYSPCKISSWKNSPAHRLTR